MKIRGLSIKLKIMIVTNVLIICTIGLLSYSFLKQMKDDMVYMGVEQARIAARMAVLQIDGDTLEQLEAGDEDTVVYQDLLSQLRDIKQNCGMAYLYTLKT
ncbi:MAG: methyl-accepting chemotaxis protein, partial [Acetatifactor sp.]|nr:methyl-accepting chemotaxis protein [Acetatifactor sp.]